MTTAAMEVRLLGELQIVRNGRTMELPASKKTRSLLGYLAATGRTHLRTHLCELLWDGPDDPRAALRWSLAKLRPLVNDASHERLAADREHAWFESKGVTVDLHAARAALSAAAMQSWSTETLESLANTFRGELLEGLELPGCYRFHQWCVGEREAARALRVGLLEALVERARSQPERALGFARQRVAVDPLSESAHVTLIELLGELGRIKEALEQVESCKRILGSELRTQPTIALERARMALTARPQKALLPSELPPPERKGSRDSATERDATEPPRSTVTPLMARAKERTAIAESIAAAREQHPPRVLLFLGDPGMGKTRLLAEVAEQARASGGRAVAGRAFEAEMVRPYGAWIDALAAVPLAQLSPDAVRDAQPLLGASPESAPGDQSRLFDAVVRLLSALGREAPPLAVILDDIHWIDEASAALLHFVIRASVPGLVVACGARPAELYDNAHALRLVRALGRDRRLVEATLEPMDSGSLEALARTVAGDLDVSRVLTDCQGNPFFAMELARALAGGATSSARIEQLLDERLARLEGRAADVVTWAAALGRSFQPDLLGRVTGLPSVDLLAAVEELERRGVIRAGATAGPASYDFTHDLLRVSAYRRLSEPRRKLVHLHIARALAEEGDSFSGDVAHHAAIGGDIDRAARACVAAGKRSVRLCAGAAANELVKRGLHLASTLPQRSRIELMIDLYGVATHARVQRAEELEEGITKLFVEAQSAGMIQAAQWAMYHLLVVRYYNEDWVKAAEESLRIVEVTEHGDASSVVHGLTNGGSCLALLGREIPKARAMLTRATELAAVHGVPLAMSQHRLGVGVTHHFLGELDAAVRELGETVATARREDDHFRSSLCLVHLAMIALERAQWDLALSRARELAQVAEKLGDGSERAFADTVTAVARRRQGEPGAASRIEAGLEELRKVDSKGLLAYMLTHAAEIELEAGNAPLAARYAREASAAATVVARASEAAVARALLGRVAACSGDRDAATESLRSLMDDLRHPCALSARAHGAAAALAAVIGFPLAAEMHPPSQ